MVHYNETSDAEDENEKDGPTSSNNDRRRAATRNTTENTDDKDYVAQLPKRKPKTD